MANTFKKFISIVLMLTLVLSLVPFGAMAETAPTEARVKLKNAIWVYDNTNNQGKIQNYKSCLQFSRPGTGNYKSVFQLDFSGYEYLLRDDDTRMQMYVRGGGAINNTSKRLYDYNMYILSDKNDAYAEHYEPYSDASSGMTALELKSYVTPLTSETGLTPFVQRVDATVKNSSTASVVSSDANNAVLINALDASTDDSVVTVQVVDGPATNKKNSNGDTENFGAFTHNSDLTYLKITCSDPSVTPAKYVADTKAEIAWSMISSDERDNLRSDLNFASLTKYKGIDITWSSSAPHVINAETGVVTRNRYENKLTLTANLSYTDYTGGVTKDTVDFYVTVPALSLDESPVFGDTVNEGDTVLGFRKNYTATHSRMISVKEGLGGKGETDAYLLYGDVGGTREISLSNATGNQDTLEMSVYVPSGSKGMSMNVYVKNPSGYTGLNYHILPDGIYIKYSNSKPKIASLKPDRWYNLAFVTPEPYSASSAENDNAMKLYVNGVLKSSNGLCESTTGYDSRFNPRLNLLDVTSSAEPPAIYLDNIRIHSAPYAPEYDVLDKISYKDGIEGNKIIVKGSTTVGQLKDGITKKNGTAIRVYKNLSDAQLSDDAVITGGETVVAAADNGSEMERSYNYYTINKISHEVITETKVNGEVSDVYDYDDEILVSTKVSNYTESNTISATMYVAQYKYGTLTGVWESTENSIAPGDGKTLTCNLKGMTDREGSNIKVIVTDGNLAPFAKPVTMHYKGGKEKTTLWLLGDSTVQDYEDKILDPIQGWGFHIGSYLNENVTVKNRARGGWTTDHYMYPDNVYTREDGVNSAGETLNIGVVDKMYRYCVWENVKKEIAPGDYLILNLGINDSGAVNGATRVSKERFRENVETIYAEATALGATVIFATPVPSGGSWDTDSFSFPGGRQNFGKVLTSVAEENGFVCLPFGATVYSIYNDMANSYLAENEGATKVQAYNYVRNYFHLFMSKGTPPEGYQYSGEGNDSTHHNTVASKYLAKILAQLLVESGSTLGDYVVLPQ